jgi:hypothetical protein
MVEIEDFMVEMEVLGFFLWLNGEVFGVFLWLKWRFWGFFKKKWRFGVFLWFFFFARGYTATLCEKKKCRFLAVVLF